MNTLEQYLKIDEIDFDVAIKDCLAFLQPHPKFASCTFDNYRPDPKYPSQQYIKNLLAEKMEILNKSGAVVPGRGLFFRKKPAAKAINNVYIDGSFGIGKTHLLASCFNLADVKKAFMSFTEMTYFFNYMGLEETIRHFSSFDLLLIDEFELDDPATTLIMARFFTEVNKDTLIITTSNTLPADLGKNKIQVDEFERELGAIANSFTTVVVEGEDFRRKHETQTWKRTAGSGTFLEAFSRYTPEKRGKIFTDFASLMGRLEKFHPFRYFTVPLAAEAIFIEGLAPLTSLNNALRFTHFIDMCYYYNTRLFIKADINAETLYSPEMIESSFQKKLLRSLSRLDELAIFYHG